jgi:hypothetical protein
MKIKSRRMHVVYVWEMRNAYLGKPEGKRSLGRLGLDGRVILKWVIEK